eukprot:gnl/TRDRNA2_/TRDRNA2_189445_c0_seq1.p1 gnl/TRDRNA2_/TRDRNA2_189445_c0~~gnl/TRDRNA2_/TRDRNA2_189445_c0_seq1.p1  ORF type:complete len:103 (+),score=2.05 gnl/TRDRNA2_/TRDRNA2_189445_c0_seq1:138-446(+)
MCVESPLSIPVLLGHRSQQPSLSPVDNEQIHQSNKSANGSDHQHTMRDPSPSVLRLHGVPLRLLQYLSISPLWGDGVNPVQRRGCIWLIAIWMLKAGAPVSS